MTNQQGVPEALRLADALEFRTTSWPDKVFAAAELRRLHALTEIQQQELISESHRTAEQKLRADQMTRQHADQAAMNREARAKLAALVDAQQPATHVQNPAGIEHVAGDVSKNEPESNMAQQPAPSAAAFDEHGFRDWVLRNLPKGSIIGNGEWWADHLTSWAKRFVKAAPQPSPTPQADSVPSRFGSPELQAMILARCVEKDQADSVQEDSARLDFLIEQRAYVVSDPDACPGYWLHWAMPDGRTWVQGDEHPTPRAAIDAGRKQEPDGSLPCGH